MKQFSALLITLFIFSNSFAGNENFPVGARAAGLGNAAVTLDDMWAAFHNQAGTAYLKNVNVGVYNEIRYGLSELSLNAFAVAVPVKDVGTFSLSATYFGYKLYNEQKIGLAYARKFGDNISGSLQFDYLATNINDEYYGNQSAFAVEAGFRAKLLPNLDLGFHVYNPTRAKMADYTDERIPTVMKLGLCYHFNDKVLFAVEAEKTSAAKNIFKAGIEYQIAKPLYLRAGIATNQTTGYFGFGLNLKQIKINFTASFHETLGFTPHTDLSYEFGGKE
ncbi:MAG: hypothetical protein ABI723_14305 [Bacteroidia bacterium]